MTPLVHMVRGIIRYGGLTLIGPHGRCSSIGDEPSLLVVRITESSGPRRSLLNPDVAPGEAYMDGHLTIEGGDIYDFLVGSMRHSSMPAGNIRAPTLWTQAIRSSGRNTKRCATSQSSFCCVPVIAFWISVGPGRIGTA